MFGVGVIGVFVSLVQGENSGCILLFFCLFCFFVMFFSFFFVFQFVDVLDYHFIVFHQIYELWGSTNLTNQ